MKRLLLPIGYFLLAIAYVIWSNYTLFLAASTLPMRRVFPLYQGADTDYNMYLSTITQGKYGAWLLTNPMSTTPANPSLFYFFFILVGKIAALFSLESHVAYHLVRLVGVLLFILIIPLFMQVFLQSKLRWYASIAAIVLTTFPVHFFYEPKAYIEYLQWWDALDAVRRLEVFPHYIVSTVLLLGAILVLKKFPVYTPLIGAVVFFIGIIQPPMLFPMLVSLPLAVFIETVVTAVKEKRLVFPQKLKQVFFLVFCGLSAYALIYRENFNGAPWNAWSSFEQNLWKQPYFFPKLLLGFGLSPYIGLIAAIPILLSGSMYMRMLVFWAYSPFFLYPFVDSVGISRYRLFTDVPQIPLAMLLVLALEKLEKRLGIRNFTSIAFAFFTILSFATSLDTYGKYLPYYKLSRIESRFVHIFVPTEDWNAIAFIQKHTNVGDGILSNRYFGSLIPAHAPVRSYAGHHLVTPNFFFKLSDVEQFYRGLMTNAAAFAFLKENNIRYVYFGWSEKQMSETLPYTFLTPIFSEYTTTVYQVLPKIP